MREYWEETPAERRRAHLNELWDQVEWEHDWDACEVTEDGRSLHLWASGQGDHVAECVDQDGSPYALTADQQRTLAATMRQDWEDSRG